MDEDVKAILADLYRALSDRLERSHEISDSVRRLEELGYKLSMYLEATILLERDEAELAAEEAAGAERKRGAKKRRRKRKIRSGTLKLDESDVSFLKSLKISVTEDKKKGEKKG